MTKQKVDGDQKFRNSEVQFYLLQDSGILQVFGSISYCGLIFKLPI